MRDVVENLFYGFIAGVMFGIAIEFLIYAITGGWLEIVKR